MSERPTLDGLLPEGPAAVAGLGKSGEAAVAFLLAHGRPVLACDDGSPTPVVERLEALIAQGAPLTLRTGGLPAKELTTCGAILLSPGIRRDHPAIAEARGAGVEVINDVELLHRWVRTHQPEARFAAITGANGKSTVTTLLGRMMEASGAVTRTGGNLGTPALALWDEATRVYVLELSSFQLESVAGFRAEAAALLNLTPDHMDRYPTVAAYLAAKARVFERQQAGDVAILDGDDPQTLGPLAQRLAAGPARWVPITARGGVAGGVGLEEGWLVDRREGAPRRILPLERIRMGGPRINAASAAALAFGLGASEAAVVEVLKQFPGLPHRVEHVRTLEGVGYYNDSKGTNVGATAQALASFDQGVVLIAGGRDKAGVFEPLRPLLAQRGAGLVLIGEAADKIGAALAGAVPTQRAGSLIEAVEQARRLAPPGGVVLLSPACASFDMFRNFEDRGEQFREAVHGLA
ncbi:MAG: UDP-N-acetylmuramoyl-L-alanine--D-glutamate ligase [Magnetococcales bacterium]|nr:UDP-N-acetylmuramoyl-L-alanine--D-glutamate ligase [Magnetococcales bacterium]